MAIPNDYPYSHFENLGKKWRECYICNRWFPENQMVKYKGHYYCENDFRWRWDKKEQDKYRPKITDNLD